MHQKVCEIVGYPEKELLKLTFQGITRPEVLNIDLDLFNEMIKGKRSHYQIEKHIFIRRSYNEQQKQIEK